MAACFATYKESGEEIAYLGTVAEVDAVAERLRQRHPDADVRVTHKSVSSWDCPGWIVMHAWDTY